jgi:hypothetical protein
MAGLENYNFLTSTLQNKEGNVYAYFQRSYFRGVSNITGFRCKQCNGSQELDRSDIHTPSDYWFLRPDATQIAQERNGS